MKNILLILSLMLVVLNWATAQTCEPDKTLPDSVIVYPLPYQDTVPGTGIMDTACVNSYFETVLQFQIPSTFPLGGGSVPLDKISLATEGAVAGAPAGFDYVCNPPNCVFEKDSTGCIVLYGTPQTGSEDVYDLKVTVVVTVLGSSLPPFTLPDGTIVTGNYYLHVKEEGFANCKPLAARDLLDDYLSLSNAPNPFGDYTEIRVSSIISGDFSFEVYDLLGQRVHRESVRLYEGANTVPFDGSNLANGMYHYVFRNRQGVVSGKMLISRGSR